jgi:integrase
MKVTIENHARRLRLRWLYQGKRYTMACGVNDDANGRAIAKLKAAQIEKDLINENFDPTLLKYKPRILDKTATELSCPELFDRWLRAMTIEKALSPGSLRRYQGCGYHLRRSLNIRADQVTPTKAANFTSVLLESVCNRTAKEYLWMLKSCWDWAKGKYHIAEENPWLSQVAKVKPQPQQKVKPFTVAEVGAILNGFKSDRHYWHYHDFIAFLFGVACRIGEAAGLRWKHIADNFETCWIGESVSRGVRKSTKTGKARTVLLSPSVQSILKTRYIATNPKPDNLVFPAPNGGAICSNNFNRRAWHTVLERCNISYRKPYGMRHSAISHALANGANPIDLAEQTGHDKRVLLSTYAHAINQESLFVEF